MRCAIAIQYLPMDATTDEQTCRVVDEVIAYIESTGVDYSVGPFETTIEGDYERCMEVLRGCLPAGTAAGCEHAMAYVKIDFRPHGDVMSTERKVAKYHGGTMGRSDGAARAVA